MDFDLRCENATWAATRTFTTQDRAGYDVMVVVAKLAYAVSFQGAAQLTFRPVRFEPAPDRGGGLKYPDDLADEKRGTDVGLIGTSHPPRGAKDSFVAWVRAGGELQKAVRVFGPRTFVADGATVVPGPPGPVGPTPLRYDLAWGELEQPYNPIGRGLSMDPRALLGRPAPQLEVETAGSLSRPRRAHASFAPIEPSWEPRRRLAGTHDLEWRRKRAPFRPKDFDLRHHDWAVPELHADDPLQPDVPVEVGGVRPEGIWRFKLPAYSVAFTTRQDGDYTEHKTHLDGYLIDADEGVVELTFRASVRLPLKWERLERIFVTGVGEMPQEAHVTEPSPEPSRPHPRTELSTSQPESGALPQP